MKVVYSPICLNYFFPGHPESPDRIKLIYNELCEDTRFEFVEPTRATENDLLLVHTQQLTSSVKNNTFLDNDTPNIKNIYDFALTSVGSAIMVAKLAEEKGVAFSLSCWQI